MHLRRSSSSQIRRLCDLSPGPTLSRCFLSSVHIIWVAPVVITFGMPRSHLQRIECHEPVTPRDSLRMLRDWIDVWPGVVILPQPSALPTPDLKGNIASVIVSCTQIAHLTHCTMQPRAREHRLDQWGGAVAIQGNSEYRRPRIPSKSAYRHDYTLFDCTCSNGQR